MWMIVLVITIPVYVSAAMAGFRVTESYGNDKIHGYRRRTDNTTVVIDDVYIDGDADIAPSQTLISFGSYSDYFDSCTPRTNNRFVCSYSDRSTIGVSKIDYTINLFNDAGVIAAIDALSISLDNAPPVIELFEVEPELTNTPNVTFKFRVRDTDHEGGTGCTGVKKVDIFKEDYSNASIKSFTDSSPDCIYENNGTYSYPADETGTYRLCIRAYDAFNQESTGMSCDSFAFDNTAPVIQGIEILDAVNMSPVQYVGEDPVSAFVRVNVSGDSIENVRANLNSLNPGSAYANRTYDSFFPLGNNKYTYVWAVPIDITSSKSPVVAVSANDNAGNTAVAELMGQRITFDNVGPLFKQITTGLEHGGKIYAGFTADFMAIVDDLELNEHKIYIALDKLGGSASDMADTCKKVSDSWYCYWFNRTIVSSDGAVGVVESTLDSQDDLGNRLNETIAVNVTVDKIPPIVSNITITKVAGEYDYGEDLIIKSDHLNIAAAVQESNSLLVAYGNFTSAISTEAHLPAVCTNANGTNEWECIWETGAIDISGPYIAPLYFKFIDVANNTMPMDDEIKVFGLENESSPNHWSHSVSCSPELVDRQITSFINQRIYCHVPLAPINPGQGPEIISINLGECFNAINGSADYIQSVELMNHEGGSTDPYLQVTLKAAEFTIDELEVKCPLGIQTRIGDSIYANPENENVTVGIGFYNLPAGELSKDVKDKIQDAKDDASGAMWETITMLKKLFFYLEKICSALNTLFQIVGIWEVVHAAWNTASKAATPIGTATMEGTRIEMCLTKETAAEYAKSYYRIEGHWFCKFVNCRASPMPGGGKTGDFKTWGSWLGGGGGITGLLRSKDSNLLGIDPSFDIIQEVTGKEPESYMNVKDSLVWSVLSFCIPGIIYNLDKYRQILCLYADCLESNAEYSMPISVCEDMKAYQECKYVMGEIFNLIPFVAVFNYYINLFKNAMSDPFSIIGAVLGLGCAYLCGPGSGDANTVCSWIKVFSMITETITELVAVFDMDTWAVKTDYCSKMDGNFWDSATTDDSSSETTG